MSPASGPSPNAWLFHQTTFGPLHIVTVAFLLFLMLGATWLGRTWRKTRREHRLRHLWAWLTIGWQAIAVVWYLWPSHFDLAESLPLQLCDIAAWIAPLALLTQARFFRTLLFFWGIGLSTQAFLTPVVDRGIDSFEYWLFWIGHTQIVGSAIYDFSVLGYRPAWRDFVTVTLVNLGCLAAILPFDLLTDTNYWYVGNMKPDHPTLIDRLGPWPMRIVWMFLIAEGTLALLWLAASAACRHAEPASGSIHSTA